MNILSKIWDFLVNWGDVVYEFRKNNKISGTY